MPNNGELFPTNENGQRIVLPFDEWNYLDTYKKMQNLINSDLTKAIGVSNYNLPKLKRLLNDPEISIIPACNQVEMHPCLPQPELVEFCKSNNILIECYSPLGSTGAPVLQNESLKRIAENHKISPACTAISWGIARDVILLPKSVNNDRIINNLKIVDLHPDSIKEIEQIGKDSPRRVVNPDWTVKVNIFEDFDYY
jgi:glycerol 2-dehydrogenase (NADP+)